MVSLTTDQRIINTVLKITNKRGDPAPVDGAPVWESSDPTVLKVEAAADGMSAPIIDTLTPSPVVDGAPVAARYTITAKPFGGDPLVFVSDDIVVLHGSSERATSLDAPIGTIEDKPVA